MILQFLVCLLLFSTALVAAEQGKQHKPPKQQRILITNDSLSPMDVFWVNPTTLELMQMNSELIPHGTSSPYVAFVGHEFEVHERPNGTDGQTCHNKESTCRRTLVKVTGKDENKQILINREFEVQRQSNSDTERPSKMRVLNKSGSKLDLYWRYPETGQELKMTHNAISPGDTLGVDTFTNHYFEIRQVGSCEVSNVPPCQKVQFQNPNQDTPHITITRQFQAIWEGQDISISKDEATSSSSFTELLQKCYQQQQQQQQFATATATSSFPAMMDCVEHNLALRIVQTNEELTFERTLRENVGAKLENFTCLDDTLETSTPIAIEQWYHHQGKEEKDLSSPRTVWRMFDRPAAKIHVVHDFISEEECHAMEEEAVHKLQRGSVADGKGGVALSDHRKALQAGIYVPWDKEPEGNPIATLSRRVYDYVDHVLHLNITEHGQEDLMSIQYKGRGLNDTAPDQYKPHCDGDCDGLPHKTGTRMATMVMYCTLPKHGGHTNFRNANVHVKPQKYMAVFFSYMDPKTKLMDTVFTEHSGCPVWEGEKKIVTQWVRYGVSSEHPHTSFNTMGVKISEADW